MFVHMVAVWVMQVAVVQVVRMAVMQHSDMPAVGAMLMVVIGVVWGGAGGHSLGSLVACVVTEAKKLFGLVIQDVR